MRISVEKVTGHIYYLNFDLIVEFFFNKEDEGYFYLSYTSTTGPDNWDKIKISEEEKNKILNKLGL
jgi:hypothetical protein